MAGLLIYLKQPKCIYLCTYIWLATLAVMNAQEMLEPKPDGGNTKNSDLESQPIELAALGRPLFPGMLYDCRKDNFIPGVTLWDKKSLSEDLDSRPQLKTDFKFESSDSFSAKSNLLDVSASLKASFLGGLVEVGGSAKFLRDSKSSNQQSRMTMHHSETTRFEQLTMTHLGQITYPQVFDQKTATHVVTAVLYGAQAFMVFDRRFSEEESRQEVEGELNIMVKNIPLLSIEGQASLKMTDGEKKKAEKIACTFYGDVHLNQNPTTYMEALELYKKLPSLLKENSQNGVPLKVWLYPLHLLDTKAARLEREISTSAVSYIVDIMEELSDVERTCNDLSRKTEVNMFSSIKERLRSFKSSVSFYKALLLKAVAKVLPGIRGGDMEEKSLKDIQRIHSSSPFNAVMHKQWLNDAKTEVRLLSSYTKTLKEITIVDSDSLKTILLDPDIDFVVCLTFTSLQYEDPYLSTLQDFLKSDQFQDLDGEIKIISEFLNVRKWFNNPDVISTLRENIILFRSFSEANKNDKKFRFIISAISDPSSPGSSIYLYEKGKLTDTKFQPLSKPPPPIVKNILRQAVSLKLHEYSTEKRLKYRVEYNEVTSNFGAEEKWFDVDTADVTFNLIGILTGKHYSVQYRTVSNVGVSEASDAVNIGPLYEQAVLVGGTDFPGTSFLAPSSSAIKMIQLYYKEMPWTAFFSTKEKWIRSFTAVKMTFHSGHRYTAGRNFNEVETFLFDEDDKIVAAKLWPNKDNNRFCGLWFVVEKSNGRKTHLSAKCHEVGNPVSVDVKSGKCYGITARAGSEVDFLGFHFI
ncbi:cytolytic toxin-alpha-like [Puntigrus tetrazona]|uniref:cytolytic toxin-alpha-like n=1 Tax=Puntigrus tetrazona TaxID=1606681 RepID=UPI001C8A7979|nr:cytolytic toxin-alpha-like [Puntigrus tetrazona]